MLQARFSRPKPFTAAGGRQTVPVCAAVKSVDQTCHSPVTAALHSASRRAALAGVLSVSLLASGAALARPEGVNRPELLPKEFSPVIDVAGFLTPSEESRVRTEVEHLEQDTGFKLRVLAQNYPETPGLAIRDFWGVDDNTIVFVADPTFGDILNFNVGQGVDLEVPRSFWNRLAGKFGNKFFWQDNGEAASILNAVSVQLTQQQQQQQQQQRQPPHCLRGVLAFFVVWVSAIDSCLREPSGKLKCSNIQGEFGEKPSSGKFGKLFGL
eukprot:jgi/Chrzof1/10324/Cz04g37150.t1